MAPAVCELWTIVVQCTVCESTLMVTYSVILQTNVHLCNMRMV